MGFLSSLFRSPLPGAAVLISISSSSVSGAYVVCASGRLPVVLYSKRIPISPRDAEPVEKAMVRAFETLGDSLIREGSVQLSRTIGHGTIEAVFVSIDSPWQETRIHQKRLAHKSGFTVSREVVAEAVQETLEDSSGSAVVDESIIATTVNGYRLRNSLDKKTDRAIIEVIASLVPAKTLKSIDRIVKKLYHSHTIHHISGPSVRYQALHRAFPHEKDFILIDASPTDVSLLLIRNGLLVSIAESPHDAVSKKPWEQKIESCLSTLAKQFPLPRTLMLLPRDMEALELKERIENTRFETLRYWNASIKTIPVLRPHVNAWIASPGQTTDLPLLLMGMQYDQHVRHTPPNVMHTAPV